MTAIGDAVFWAVVAATGAAWVVSAVAFGLWIGRVIRNRDRQIPRHRHAR